MAAATAPAARPAAPDRLLAVCGGAASVWKATAGVRDVTVTLPRGESASAAAWHPAQAWTAVGTLGGQVHLLAADGTTVLCTLSVSPGAAVRAICFGSQGRFLWASGDGKAILCFDLQSKETAPLKCFRVRRVYSPKYRVLTCLFLQDIPSPVLALALSNVQSHIACGLDNGKVMVFSSTNGTATTLSTECTLPIRALEFSPFRRGLLVAGCDDGRVLMFDVLSSISPLHTFDSAHVGPCRGVAFSPQNKYFLVTAGTDRRIVLFDAEKKQIIRTINTPSALSSVAFRADGQSVAAGSLTGEVLVYDLRAISQPLVTLRVSESGGDSVTSVAYQPASSAAAAPSPTVATGKESASDARLDSPLFPRAAGEPTVPLPPAAVVAEDPLEVKPRRGLQLEAQDRPAAQSPTPVDAKPSPAPPKERQSTPTPPPSAEGDVSPRLFLAPGESVEGAAAAPQQKGPVLPPIVTGRRPVRAASSVALGSPALSSSPSSSSALPSAAARTPALSDTFSPLASSPLSSAAATTSTAAPSSEALATLDRRALVGIVEEAIEGLRASIHQELQNMHLEMLYQFHNQRREIEALVQRLVPTAELLDELRRLREENARLRHLN